MSIVESRKKYKKQCPVCFSVFYSYHSAVYCSTKCRVKANSENNRPVSKSIGKEAANRVLGKDDGKCHWCGCEGKKLSIDHVIPISKGGSNDESNLVPCCASCNSAKAARSVKHLHKFRSIRNIGAPLFVTVRVMDWLIEKNLTTYRYPPNPWDEKN
jgi:5-methylcytosine-specific restriction endonuclease McrA